MKYDLSNIMDEYSYLMRDYSAIVQRVVTKMPHLTTKWTDFSITEPDTILLSNLAYIFDQVNYTIDYDYMTKILEHTKSTEYLSDLYQIHGLEMKDYESLVIECTVENLSDVESLSIPKWSLLRLESKSNEIFSLLDEVHLRPEEETTVRIVRGGSRSIILSKDDFKRGEYVIPNPLINRESVSLYINEREIPKSDELSISLVRETYSLIQYQSDMTILKLSPTIYKQLSGISRVRLQYTMMDNYPLMKGSKLYLRDSSSDNYEIVSNESYVSKEVTVDTFKYNYHTNLGLIYSLYNKKQNINDLLGERVDYVELDGDTIRYSTVDNTPLSSILKSGVVDYKTGEVVINLERDPVDNVTIEYTDAKSNLVRYVVTSMSKGYNSIGLGISTVPGSIRVVFNSQSEVRDNAVGQLVNYKIESEELYKRVESKLLMTDKVDLKMSMYNIRRLDISAIVYITTPGVDPYDIHERLMVMLKERFVKGVDAPGSSVQRIQLSSLIKGIDSSLGKVEILHPNFDVVLPLDSLLELGSVMVEYRRGGRSVWIES